MPFNFNARYALLTYSQCGDLDGWEVSNHFTKLRAECIVAREAHADGGIHLHAFVDFGPGRKFRSRRSDVFDVGGFHPNISPTHSTPQSGFDYACKDGDIVAGGLERPTGSVESRTNADWSTIVTAPTRDEFLQLSWNNLHELCAPHSLLWRSTLIGDIGLIQSRISMTATYASTLIHFQNSLHGHSSTLQDLQNQVSRRTSRRGPPPELRVPARASLARGDPPPLECTKI